MKRYDKTKFTSAANRRLDKLAKLLTGKSVCATVAFYDSDENNKKLLISTNKISNEEANKLNIYFKDATHPSGMRGASNVLGQTLKLLTECAQGAYSVSKAKALLFPAIYHYVIGGKLLNQGIGIQNLIVAVNSNNSYRESLTSYIKKAGDKGISADDHATSLIFISKKDQIIESTQGQQAKDTITKFLISLSKIEKDINKICEILYTDKYQDLKNTIKSKSFILVGPHSNIIYSDKDHHSEMNIISYLLRENYSGEWYLGISKLTCFDCTHDIMITNNYSDLTILIRGEHNVKYSSRRIEPELPQLEEQVVAHYRKVFERLPHQGRELEYADSSDSEVEILGES